MAGIDKAAIAFTIAIVAAGVGMALYGEGVQSAPAATAPAIPTPAAMPADEPEPQTDTFAALADKVKEDTAAADVSVEVAQVPPATGTEEPAPEAEAAQDAPEAEAAPAPAPAGPQTVTVDIPVGTSVPGCEETNACYLPMSVTINAGDTVEWANVDTAAHTVTSGLPSSGPSGEFDSSLIMVDASFAFTFDEPGSYDYFCMVHPWMIGDVQVN